MLGLAGCCFECWEAFGMARFQFNRKSVDVFVLRRDGYNRSDDDNRRCWLVLLNTELGLWHGAHNLDNFSGRCFFMFTLFSFVECICLQSGNIRLCMPQPKSYLFLGCSGRIFLHSHP